MAESELDRLFGADGLIHTAPRQNPSAKRRKKELVRPEDPTVCLTCTAEHCDGADECYRKRKKQLEIQRREQNENKNNENPA